MEWIECPLLILNPTPSKESFVKALVFWRHGNIFQRYIGVWNTVNWTVVVFKGCACCLYFHCNQEKVVYFPVPKMVWFHSRNKTTALLNKDKNIRIMFKLPILPRGKRHRTWFWSLYFKLFKYGCLSSGIYGVRGHQILFVERKKFQCVLSFSPFQRSRDM